jgi:hypothetical protein
MFDKKDRYRHLRDIKYICNECGTTFTYWRVHDDDWNASGFDWKAVCKFCFEKRVPNPRYLTFEEYCQWHIKEFGFTFYPELEKENQELDHLRRMYIRRYGVANWKEYMHPPIDITEPAERTWICTNCMAEIKIPFAAKPPEICQTCGK